ncbi:MAG TPA: GGDEF domain-containing protein, partial [bacterium]|nr:GGDEF domain-containing protein [bacterium]
NLELAQSNDVSDSSESAWAPRQSNTPVSENDAVERAKLVIHGLLLGVSESIESLLTDSTKHTDSIEQHKVAVKKAMTVAGIKELERLILDELEKMRSSNDQYRGQLSEANGRLKIQQDVLEKLQADVRMDFLTKLSNRRAFDTRFVEETERARRYGHQLSLILMDADRFKAINDVYGHVAGDRILRGVAKVIEGETRSSDFVARYGGEEFVLLLPETSMQQASAVAEKIRKKIEQTKFWVDTRNIKVTVSLGVAQFDAQNDTRESFLKRADAAMYRAKEAGRNRVEC